MISGRTAYRFSSNWKIPPENKDQDVPFARTAFHADTHSSESAFGAVANTSGDSLRGLDTDNLFLIDIVLVLVQPSVVLISELLFVSPLCVEGLVSYLAVLVAQGGREGVRRRREEELHAKDSPD